MTAPRLREADRVWLDIMDDHIVEDLLGPLGISRFEIPRDNRRVHRRVFNHSRAARAREHRVRVGCRRRRRRARIDVRLDQSCRVHAAR